MCQAQVGQLNLSLGSYVHTETGSVAADGFRIRLRRLGGPEIETYRAADLILPVNSGSIDSLAAGSDGQAIAVR